MRIATSIQTDSSRGQQLWVHDQWCKGCGICIALCPHGVLGLSEERTVSVQRPDRCSGCRQCELHCPDFVFELTPTATRDNGQHPGGSR